MENFANPTLTNTQQKVFIKRVFPLIVYMEDFLQSNLWGNNKLGNRTQISRCIYFDASNDYRK